ncbi:MAG: winged helix-turn-helix transcriptional regulator, partial [Thermoplasmata archaeon]|nr:winged helix-turn-helix transcriptional regulator [Thermoplasmata archaeon]
MKSMIAEFDKRLNPEVKELNFDCRTTKDSTFMNVTRCAIFEYLCHHPCSTATMVARRIKISESTVRWHLRKLMKEKFVSADENGNTVFFPLNMIWP